MTFDNQTRQTFSAWIQEMTPVEQSDRIDFLIRQKDSKRYGVQGIAFLNMQIDLCAKALDYPPSMFA